MHFGYLTGFALVGSLSLAVIVEPELSTNRAYRRYEGSNVQIAMGDAQRLLASQFYAKADVYMHRGYYPSIFDSKEEFENSHRAAPVGGPALEHADESQEPDWIERFGRSFYPSRHTHLGDGQTPCNDPEHHHEDDPAPEDEHDHENCDHEHHEESPTEDASAEIREILPWLKASAELDPEREETFVTGAYWLRTRLNRVEEAEEFLWQGWERNPDSYQIVFELGRLQAENRGDDLRARNLWLGALSRWERQEQGKEEPDTIMYAQILWQLALLEERNGEFAKAAEYLRKIQPISRNPEKVGERIEELQARISSGSAVE